MAQASNYLAPERVPAPAAPCCCGSSQAFEHCCQPLLEGADKARTAEQLMRSRYSAHVTGQIQYIIDTWAASQRAALNTAAIRDWAVNSNWLGLQVLTTKAGKERDCEGWVEFVASFIAGGEPQLHRENSYFVREDGRWVFVEQ